jgi:hypothetical protein
MFAVRASLIVYREPFLLLDLIFLFADLSPKLGV